MRTALGLVLCCVVAQVSSIDLKYLEPKPLQTVASDLEQQEAATQVIKKYFKGHTEGGISINIQVFINPTLFDSNNNDQFCLSGDHKSLNITATSGVAAVWGFNYYLKKYLNSHIGWKVQQFKHPSFLKSVNEIVTARDRFRVYHHPISATYTSAWWDVDEWIGHVDWMALNGINVAYAPVAEEAAWANIYRRLGMTQEEIDVHFSGPAYFTWLRQGNDHGLMGPLPDSFLRKQLTIQKEVVSYMRRLGMIPLFPAFNGHVPRAFSRIFPNNSFLKLGPPWYSENCCNLFVDPEDGLFETLGLMFLNETALDSYPNYLYTAEPFLQINIKTESFTSFVKNTAKVIYSTLVKHQDRAVWVVQNTMFVHEPWLWRQDTVKAYLTSVPTGRMLALDFEAEQRPFYNSANGYYGQPFVWCMMQAWGGKFGMYGSMEVVNKYVYEARNASSSAMIGIGLSPTERDQNYVVFDLILETAWRAEPVDLKTWVVSYAQRRYDCNSTAKAWKHLLKSVYNYPRRHFDGHRILNQKPTFEGNPKTWYKSRDLFEAFKQFAFAPDCDGPGFAYDLVDVTRQAMQYRAEQLYVQMRDSWEGRANYAVLRATADRFLDALKDMSRILNTHEGFSILPHIKQAVKLATTPEEAYIYTLNINNQVTLWAGDYACKQWAELYDFYYIPRWKIFIDLVLDAKSRKEEFSENAYVNNVLNSVASDFLVNNWENIDNNSILINNTATIKEIAVHLYKKWGYRPELPDLSY